MAEEKDPRVLRPGTLPTPFTAEEIRKGCPVGRTIHLRVEAPGRPPTHRVNVFVECDEEGALISRSEATPEGEATGEVESDRSSWLELQRHASFPESRTTVTEDVIDSAMGRLDCLRYTYVEQATVVDYWFARDLPGMPVRVVSTTSGTVLSEVTMMSSTT